MNGLLGSGTVTCHVWADDISVHWWPTGATEGDLCLCGTKAKEDAAS